MEKRRLVVPVVGSKTLFTDIVPNRITGEIVAGGNRYNESCDKAAFPKPVNRLGGLATRNVIVALFRSSGSPGNVVWRRS